VRHDRAGTTIQFYVMMTLALLQLHLKQSIMDKPDRSVLLFEPALLISYLCVSIIVLAAFYAFALYWLGTFFNGVYVLQLMQAG
jgi:hypothetical protein